MATNISVTEAEKRETLSRLMRAYVGDDIILTDKEKKLYARLVAADEVVKDYGYPTTTARAEYLADKFGVSMATARRDLQMAAELFNNLEPFDPSTCARVIMHQVDKFLALCERAGDMRSAAAFMKIKASVMTDFVLSKPVDPSLFQQNNYTFVINGRMKGMAEAITPERVESKLREMNLGLTEKEITSLVEEVPYEPAGEDGENE